MKEGGRETVVPLSGGGVREERVEGVSSPDRARDPTAEEEVVELLEGGREET